MSFVRNAWYVAGWARDIDRSLAKRTILGDELVVFRKENGNPAALLDLCPHRSLPLSLGRLKGDAVQCGYHGLTFDCSGACISVPGQETIPPNARVRSYPVAERMGMIWVWMGPADLAEPADIYDLPQYHHPDWGVGHGDALHVEANYLLLTDNLCDPAHVNYVHPTTLGDPDGEAAGIDVEQRDGCVTTIRWTPDSEPVGFFKAFGNFPGKVDRWQYYHMHLPSIAIIDFGSAAAGAGAMDGNRDDCVQTYSCHFMTPVDEATTIDYWLHVRNFAPGDDSVTDGISEQFRIAFAEDKIILQAVQKSEQRYGVDGRAGIDIDAGPGLFRHLVNKALRAENPAEAAE